MFYFLDPEDPRMVIVQKLALCVEGRTDVELDLTGDLSQLKKQVFLIIHIEHFFFFHLYYITIVYIYLFY